MKKYNKPTLDCNELAMATIMAASDGGTTPITTSPTDLNDKKSASSGTKVEAKIIPNHGNKFDF